MVALASKSGLFSQSGSRYRDTLLSDSLTAVRRAQYALNAYKALSVCILSETQDDEALPSFIEEGVLDSMYDQPPADDEKNVIDFAVAQAAVFMGYETLDENYEGVKHHFIHQDDFASLEPEQLWIYYIPNSIFVHMELTADGKIPERFDKSQPYILSTYHKHFSNTVLEKQIELADYLSDILEPLTQKMMAFLDERLGLGGDVKPHYFVDVIKRAKANGDDITKPLNSDGMLSWFDLHWDFVVKDGQNAQKDIENNVTDLNIPPGTILQ